MSANETNTWPELAISLYEHLTGKNAEIIYTFEDMKIGIPSSTDENAKRALAPRRHPPHPHPDARWRLNHGRTTQRRPDHPPGSHRARTGGIRT